MLKNTRDRYGWITIGFHWLVAATVIGLFALGWWMMDLMYLDPWYNRAPHLHRSIGILLLGAMVLRLAWRLFNRPPQPLPTHSRFEVLAAHAVHWILYGLIFTALISGYLISTADGTGIRVFDWFRVPSITGRVSGMEDIAGDVHYWATHSLVVLAALHALAALKHQFIDRDGTLTRMFGARPKTKGETP